MASEPIDVEQEASAEASSGLGPKKGSRASGLWQFFKRDPPLGVSSTQTNVKAKCNFCQTDFRAKGNAALVDHFNRCKLWPAKALAQARKIAEDEGLSYADKQEGSQSGSRGPDLKKQKTSHGRAPSGLHKHFDSRAPSKEAAALINRALLLFFVMCNVSFSAVSSPYFKAFVQQLRPLYTPPGGLQPADKCANPVSSAHT